MQRHKIYIEQKVYTRQVTNTFGTICLPYAPASASGARFYEVVGKGTIDGIESIYLASVNTLEAGIPYFFEKTADEIKVVYDMTNPEAAAQVANGLYGVLCNHGNNAPPFNYLLVKYVDADRAYPPPLSYEIRKLKAKKLRQESAVFFYVFITVRKNIKE